eukprot:scaffold239580_cov37-Prasinocladus_malaysianus.AAC.1
MHTHSILPCRQDLDAVTVRAESAERAVAETGNRPEALTPTQQHPQQHAMAAAHDESPVESAASNRVDVDGRLRRGDSAGGGDNKKETASQHADDRDIDGVGEAKHVEEGRLAEAVAEAEARFAAQ